MKISNDPCCLSPFKLNHHQWWSVWKASGACLISDKNTRLFLATYQTNSYWRHINTLILFIWVSAPPKKLLIIPSGYLTLCHAIDGPFIDGLPMKKMWFSMAILNNQRVIIVNILWIYDLQNGCVVCHFYGGKISPIAILPHSLSLMSAALPSDHPFRPAPAWLAVLTSTKFSGSKNGNVVPFPEVQWLFNPRLVFIPFWTGLTLSTRSGKCS